MRLSKRFVVQFKDVDYHTLNEPSLKSLFCAVSLLSLQNSIYTFFRFKSEQNSCQLKRLNECLVNQQNGTKANEEQKDKFD